MRHLLANIWQLRRQDSPAASSRRTFGTPEAASSELKGRAAHLGASLVGIARVTEAALYEGRESPYRLAICIGQPMDREEMRFAPQPRAAVEVMRTYREVAGIAIGLAEQIRAMGWPARAYGNPNSTDILHIPLAIAAGLGTLGKHGSIISKTHGSNMRLAAVLTNLPLAVDRPVDIGVDDLCQVCRRCVDDCPPNAIFDEKQLVRGERKWYVDFDKCVPYFTKTYGCSICVETCPWSEPGRGPTLSNKLLERRQLKQGVEIR